MLFNRRLDRAWLRLGITSDTSIAWSQAKQGNLPCSRIPCSPLVWECLLRCLCACSVLAGWLLQLKYWLLLASYCWCWLASTVEVLISNTEGLRQLRAWKEARRQQMGQYLISCDISKLFCLYYMDFINYSVSPMTVSRNCRIPCPRFHIPVFVPVLMLARA